jgi:hypothetical protein
MDRSEFSKGIRRHPMVSAAVAGIVLTVAVVVVTAVLVLMLSSYFFRQSIG